MKVTTAPIRTIGLATKLLSNFICYSFRVYTQIISDYLVGYLAAPRRGKSIAAVEGAVRFLTNLA
nr:hypothetical protein [uncultured archaeon]